MLKPASPGRSYATAVAKSHTRYIAAGDDHPSHSDEELIAALPTPTLNLSSALKRKTPLAGPPQTPMRSVFFLDTPNPFVQGMSFCLQEELPRVPPALTPSPLFNTPEFQKRKLLVNSLGHKTTVPTKAQLRKAAARERWELDAERRALQQQTLREDSLW